SPQGPIDTRHSRRRQDRLGVVLTTRFPGRRIGRRYFPAARSTRRVRLLPLFRQVVPARRRRDRLRAQRQCVAPAAIRPFPRPPGPPRSSRAVPRFPALGPSAPAPVRGPPQRAVPWLRPTDSPLDADRRFALWRIRSAATLRHA